MFSPLIFLIVSISFRPLSVAAKTVHNATTVATVGWVSDGDHQRTTISLLYNCLFTIFLCTWSAMHLNVPDESDSPWRIFWRKCRWMLLGMLAPEFVALVAIEEWDTARRLVREESQLPTLTHGFTALMGGYSIRVKENDCNDIPTRRIRLKLWDFMKVAKLQSVELPTVLELMDKSKGDWVSKSITLIQIGWFIGQLIGRAVNRLPVTTLELFTCSIVGCAALTYVAWWNKPLDVQRPIVFDCEVSAAFLLEHDIYPLKTYQSLLDLNRKPLANKMSKLQRISSLVVIVLAFTAPHLIGWNFNFPTRTEQLLWRISSILCAELLILVVYYGFRGHAPGLKRQIRKWKELWQGLGVLYYCAYFLVRAYLLIEVFVGLRSVPVGVYTAVNWSAYIPHI